MSHSLDSDQTRQNVGPALNQNYFKGCQQTTDVVTISERILKELTISQELDWYLFKLYLRALSLN